jgi:hypothetical protein
MNRADHIGLNHQVGDSRELGDWRHIYSALCVSKFSTQSELYDDQLQLQLLHFGIGDSRVALDVWYTTAQEIYHSIIPVYVRDAPVVLPVHDITDEKSFDALDFWVSLLQEETPNVYIVANKLNINNKRSIEDGSGSSMPMNAMPSFSGSAQSKEHEYRQCSSRSQSSCAGAEQSVRFCLTPTGRPANAVDHLYQHACRLTCLWRFCGHFATGLSFFKAASLLKTLGKHGYSMPKKSQRM